MAIALCNFVRFKVPGGAFLPYSYQNFFVNQTVTYAGVSYAFVPFAVSSGGGKKGGDRSNSALAAPPSPISINIFAEACDNGYFLEVKTVEVDPITLTTQTLISNERWYVSGMESTPERAVLNLTSPLDAADRQIPSRYLSSTLVGSIPTSGNLTFS